MNDNLKIGGARKGVRKRRINAWCIAKLMGALLESRDGMTIADMIEVTGLSDGVLRDYVFAMRKENAAYVKQWHEDKRGACTIKGWAIGLNKPDAPRPGKRCARKRGIEYRARRATAKLLGLVSRQEVAV
jgi:hypothetical protein